VTFFFPLDTKKTTLAEIFKIQRDQGPPSDTHVCTTAWSDQEEVVINLHNLPPHWPGFSFWFKKLCKQSVEASFHS